MLEIEIDEEISSNYMKKIGQHPFITLAIDDKAIKPELTFFSRTCICALTLDNCQALHQSETFHYVRESHCRNNGNRRVKSLCKHAVWKNSKKADAKRISVVGCHTS